jgi:hypothetical protein
MKATRRLFVLAVVALIPRAHAAEGDGPSAAPIHLTPGRAILFKGTATAKQVAGAETTERRFDATALVFPGQDAKGTTRVFAVRTLVPLGPDDPAFVTFDEVTGAGKDGAAPAREFLEDSAPELEPGTLKVDLYFPLELVPPFPVPATGTESRGEAEVTAAHPHVARGAFVTAARTDAGALEVTRILAPGSRPEFVFSESPAALTGWRERYSADLKTGAPRRIETEALMEVKSEDGPIRLERKVTLEAVGSLDPTASEALERRLRDLDAACRSILPAAEIAKRVEAFRMGLPEGPHLETAAFAAARRLAAYRELFEESEAGKKLASLLGKPAPDFTLEGLDGKKVSFRDAIRGKAALLTFWGVG